MEHHEHINAELHQTRGRDRLLDAPAQPWPTSVVKPVSTVVDSLLADVTYYDGIAKATNRDDIVSAANAKVKDDSQAQKVRLRLGLPSSSSRNGGCP